MLSQCYMAAHPSIGARYRHNSGIGAGLLNLTQNLAKAGQLRRGASPDATVFVLSRWFPN